MRRLIVLLALIAAPFAVVPAAEAGGGGCHGPATAGAETTVPIEQGCFTPTVTEVAVGETVTWVNRDAHAHNVVAVGGGWGSKHMQTGVEFSHAFEAPGTYVYVCTFHPAMAGAVNVVDADADRAQPIAAVTTPPGAGNGDGPGLAGAAIVILVLLATTGAAARLLVRRPRLG